MFVVKTMFGPVIGCFLSLSHHINVVETINLNFFRFFTESESFPLLPVDCVTKSVICSERFIFDLLARLRTDKAGGSNGLNPLFLKLCADILCRPITHIINLSFQQGIFATAWEIADVRPVPKSWPLVKNQLRPALFINEQSLHYLLLAKFARNLFWKYFYILKACCAIMITFNFHIALNYPLCVL